MSERPPCQAHVAGENTRSHSMLNIATHAYRPCSRTAREAVGSLKLCTTHARMARDGLLDERGDTGSPADLKSRREKPSLRFTWAASLPRVFLPA